MRFFNYLSHEEQQQCFVIPPISFDSVSDKTILSHALGATLYMPGTRQTIAEDIISGKHEGLVSLVIDLEDAIGDRQVQFAEQSLLQQLARLSSCVHMGVFAEHQLPLIFIRIRDLEQFTRITDLLADDLRWVTGFVFPKFSVHNGTGYLEQLQRLNESIITELNRPMYALPILESEDIIYRESRERVLLGIKTLLDSYKDVVLNIRIGATDFSSIFGIRRGPDLTIYDIATIRDCIADIINVFLRTGSEYVISGPVWEYFSTHPLNSHRYMDGLMKEVLLDKENGLLGKTIIHPTHIKPVQSQYVVRHEEYKDAMSIVIHNNGNQGVLKSEFSNKMNEIKPHLSWAKKILMRAKIYGVIHEQTTYSSLLAKQAFV